MISARWRKPLATMSIDLAGLGAEDAGEVGGLVAGEGGGGGGPGVGDPAAAGHGFRCLCVSGLRDEGMVLASSETCCGGWW